jgi:hypothetical protein
MAIDFAALFVQSAKQELASQQVAANIKAEADRAQAIYQKGVDMMTEKRTYALSLDGQ